MTNSVRCENYYAILQSPRGDPPSPRGDIAGIPRKQGVWFLTVYSQMTCAQDVPPQELELTVLPKNNTVTCNGRIYRLVPETEYAPPADAPPEETPVQRPETRAGTSRRVVEKTDEFLKRARELADLFGIDENVCRDVVQKLSNEKIEELLKTAL